MIHCESRILVIMDRWLSAQLGRSCSIQEEECVKHVSFVMLVISPYHSFNLDLPIECDDEYWEPEDPAMAFKQPAGKPSANQFFNCCIRLNRIHMFALRTIVSPVFQTAGMRN